MDEFLNVDENDKDSNGWKWWEICLGIGVVAVIMASVGIDGSLYH